MFAVDIASVGTLACAGESVVGRIHALILSTPIQQVKSSSSDIKNKIITSIYYGNNKLLDS